MTTEAEAVATVFAWLPDPQEFEPDPIQVIEQPGQWTVSLRVALEPGQVQMPDRAFFRVSKATGEVDVPFPPR